MIERELNNIITETQLLKQAAYFLRNGRTPGYLLMLDKPKVSSNVIGCAL
ncbi:hypothetical protein [Pseudoalteromonas sp. BSi20439]|nr:hypothetical protein [Pseudoalteromonas sp. BSi20439]GAA72141.1 hypothetical protein P20439_2225 [Pseudoalteromonas sp. BSi20439]